MPWKFLAYPFSYLLISYFHLLIRYRTPQIISWNSNFFLQSVPHLENFSVTHLMWAWNLGRWHLSYLALCFAEPIVFFCVSLLFSYVGPTVHSGVRHRFRVRHPACFDSFLLHFFRQFQKKKHKEQNTLQMTCIFSLWLYFES